MTMVMGQHKITMRAEIREIAYKWSEGDPDEGELVGYIGVVEGGFQEWMVDTTLDSTVFRWYDSREELDALKVGDDMGDGAIITRIDPDILVREETWAVCNFDPDNEVAFVWSVWDVLDRRRDLSIEDARAVLIQCKSNHDANVGMNWDTIDATADGLFPNLDYDEDDYELDPDANDGTYRKIEREINPEYEVPDGTSFNCPTCGSRDLEQIEDTLYDSEKLMRHMKCEEVGCGTQFKVWYDQVEITEVTHEGTTKSE